MSEANSKDGPVLVERPTSPAYRADFLWPHKDGSVEEAGYEFANARTEEYRKMWWGFLMERTKNVPSGAERQA